MLKGAVMTLNQLIQMAQRRIAHLHEHRVKAERVGDIDAVTRIDTELAETQATLAQLNTLV
jgi:hypothetical protein